MPDGIGGTVKRTADRIVNEGKDVGSFLSLINILRENLRSIQIEIVRGDEITEAKVNIDEIAPHYRSKPANFDPSKVGQGRRKAQSTASSPCVQPQRVKPPPITKLPTPELMHKNVNPTPQKNHSLLEEPIFGCEVTVVPIAPKEGFTPVFAAMPTLAEEIYREYAKDVPDD